MQVTELLKLDHKDFVAVMKKLSLDTLHEVLTELNNQDETLERDIELHKAHIIKMNEATEIEIQGMRESHEAKIKALEEDFKNKTILKYEELAKLNGDAELKQAEYSNEVARLTEERVAIEAELESKLNKLSEVRKVTQKKSTAKSQN